MIQLRCGCGRLLDAGQDSRCPVCLGVSAVPGVADAPAARLPALPGPEDAPDLRRRPWISLTEVLVIAVIASVLILLFAPAVQKRRGSDWRLFEASNLKQCAIGLHAFNDVYGVLPRAVATRGPKGEPLLSWRVAILPFIEQEALFKRFRLDEAWDSPHNIALLSLMPRTYAHNTGMPSDGMTRILAVVGRRCVFDESPPPEDALPGTLLTGRTLKDIAGRQGGTAVMLVTGATPVPWTRPEDFDPWAGDIPSRLDSRFRAGTQVALLDGTIRTSRIVTNAKWAAAFTGAAPLPDE